MADKEQPKILDISPVQKLEDKDPNQPIEEFIAKRAFAYASHLPLANGKFVVLDADGDKVVSGTELGKVVNDAALNMMLDPREIERLKVKAKEAGEKPVAEYAEHVYKSHELVLYGPTGKPAVAGNVPQKLLDDLDKNFDGRITQGEAAFGMLQPPALPKAVPVPPVPMPPGVKKPGQAL